MRELASITRLVVRMLQQVLNSVNCKNEDNKSMRPTPLCAFVSRGAATKRGCSREGGDESITSDKRWNNRGLS
jgi:hypothetical protein